MRQAMAEISLTDDTGQAYDLSDLSTGGGRSRDRQEWRGDVLAALDPARKPASVELRPTGRGAPARVLLPPPARVPVGAGAAPWPTAAEGYLAALAPVTTISINQAEAGPEDTAEIVATVADSLLAVGALPATSTLLRQSPASGPGWHTRLVHRWAAAPTGWLSAGESQTSCRARWSSGQPNIAGWRCGCPSSTPLR